MKPAHQTFINEMLRHGDKARAYKTAYPNARGMALMSSANRLLSNPVVAAAICDTHSRIRAEIEAEIKAEVKEELLTLHRVKQLLTHIAEGQHTVEKQVRTKSGGYEIIDVKPTESQVLSALRLYCRLEGWTMPKATTTQPAPKKPEEPNPYLEEFRRIRRETAPKPQPEPADTEAVPSIQQPLPMPFAEPVVELQTPAPQATARIAEPAQPIAAAISTMGYTILSELIQDAWDIYIRNQNAKTWRRYQDLLRINKRSTTQPERIALCKTLGLHCHPQDERYYKPIKTIERLLPLRREGVAS